MVKALDGALHVFVVNHKTDVNLRSALRDHAHIHIGNAAEYLPGDARLLAQTFTHQADDSFAAAVLYVGELLQIAGDGGNSFAGVHRQRNADLRGGNHVHWAAMAIEYLKDGVQKAVRHEHASGYQVDDSDAAFHSDGFEHVAAARRASSDLSSRIRWIARIQHLDRNILLDCRQ